MVNPESGAEGLGQTMPATSKALAARIGTSYRPDLLRSDGPEARAYQDAIFDAALKEAWNAGGAGKDPRTSALYYHGGSNRRIWKSRTNRYADEVLERMRRLGGY